MQAPSADAIVGCLLGTAAGDAIGLPVEGLSPRRQRCLFGGLDRHHLLFGRGLTSDDTEHTCIVANALIASAGDPIRFERQLARELRRWLLTLPPAAGLATLRASLRLCLGFHPRHSGVFSAGNGPAMRSALLGVCFGHDPDQLRALVRICTRITHTDPKAEAAALAVAIAAHQSSRAVIDLTAFDLAFLKPTDYPRGPSGYCLESVPVALQAWMRHPGDFRAAVLDAIHRGGDADTTGAITGAIVGARVGLAGIPAEWLGGIVDWPGSIGWITALGRHLHRVVTTGTPAVPAQLPYLPLLLRNLFFTGVVLTHGLRRLLPPY
jgi:ADP-ribosyl-[dinitrogen reductase] hydrolase